MLAVARFIVAPISFDTAEALLLGWVIGAAAVVILGGPSRRPRGRAIAAGLAAVGVPLARLEQASLDARGSTPYFAVGTDGGQLFVKALGADERSADLLFRIYRMLLRHDLGDERPFYSLRRAVEHEALVALAAREAGVHTPAASWPWPRRSRTPSCWPTRRSTASRSTASTPRARPMPSWRPCGARCA